MSPVDGRAPCIIGVATHTWHREDVGEDGAPEPLEMWAGVARGAAADTGTGNAALDRLDSLQIVYCQTWRYDDPCARLSDQLDISPRDSFYSGIGGTTPQKLVDDVATRMLEGELDIALVTGAEALATQRAFKQRQELVKYSFKPEQKRPFPWEAPFHPAEVAHDVFQAWLTFAIFDNARRAHLGRGLDEYRHELGEMFASFTEIAAANPDAWFRVARTADEIVTASPSNRMVGYPYTKYMVSVMDVDMAAAIMLATHDTADALGVPPDQRVYVRGWCCATDPVYVAEHPDLWRSPAMAAASSEALRTAGVGIDDIAHLDLYSCFASSVNLARDALGLGDDDTRALTVTGGLPYHGGAGSDYLSHSIATMARALRRDPGSYGMVSGVGMHMTKHVYGVYSTEPGPISAPDEAGVQARLDAEQPRAITDTYDGDAVVAAYSVVHGRDGAPEWGVVVCDLPDGTRAYAKMLDAGLLDAAEHTELVGQTMHLTPTELAGPMGAVTANVATSS
jgi:acetyl-CoA C-acetyltransferase